MQKSRTRSEWFFIKYADLLLVFAWFLIFLALGTYRLTFTLDGFRHFWDVGTKPHFRLGDGRWVLTPTLIYLLYQPLEFFNALPTPPWRNDYVISVVLGASYLLMLRYWLLKTGQSVGRRLAALTLAASAYPLLRYSSDFAEPLLGAPLAVLGLTYAATRKPEQREKGLYVGVLSIVIATLIYQGLFLAIFFLPLTKTTETLRNRKTALKAFGILLLAPLFIWSLLLVKGRPLFTAAKEVVMGEQDTESKRANDQVKAMFNRSRALWVVTTAPAYAFVPIPREVGLKGTIAMLSTPNWPTALRWLTGLAFAAAVIATGLFTSIRRREYALVIALLGMLTLPAYRYFQAAYLKYYILLPLLLAIGATRLIRATWVIAVLAAFTLGFNISNEFLEITRDHAMEQTKAARTLADQN